MLVRRKPAASESSDVQIHSDLVETLFGTAGSFFAGLLGGLIAPALAWFLLGECAFHGC
ncbi:hypothetical protein HUN39_12765 [Methylocystis sp. FS]|uniref:hypothetical protein n=1 Tax=Methylocystis silviterrae TaxID=2743612 RepID=UPI00158427EF|nr:hypothetical protein [Methylocystis silviterrae]NUJ80888.1 hypothetical protein [Methylocystis silviterrae]